ncbi:MAG TPA: hypothetical protein VGK73_38425 [Polyangiaceae bacterium]
MIAAFFFAAKAAKSAKSARGFEGWYDSGRIVHPEKQKFSLGGLRALGGLGG